MNTLTTISYEDMENLVTDPRTRIVDSRMIEYGSDFTFAFQVLCGDGTIYSTETTPTAKIKPLDLFKLQYRNNPRNNPGLYGLLDGEQQNG